MISSCCGRSHAGQQQEWWRRLQLLISDYLCITIFIGNFLEYFLELGNSFISVKIAHVMCHNFKVLQETLMTLAWLYSNCMKSLEHWQWWCDKETQMHVLVLLVILVILPNLQGHGFITPWISVMTQLKKKLCFGVFLPILSNVNLMQDVIWNGIYKRVIHSIILKFFFLFCGWISLWCFVVPKSWTQTAYKAGSKWNVPLPALFIRMIASLSCVPAGA